MPKNPILYTFMCERLADGRSVRRSFWAACESDAIWYAEANGKYRVLATL